MTDETVLLNFLPITQGGGLQNSLSFLQTLADNSIQTAHYRAIVRQGSPLHHVCDAYGMAVIPVANTLSARLRFELTCRRLYPAGQACFTLFGPPPLSTMGFWLNIVGCAYSNLFYPEIWFWSHYPPLTRVKAELIDQYRRWAVSQADYWIFETPLLAERAVKLCHFPPERVGIVRMAASRLVSPDRVQPALAEQYATLLPKGFRWLLLCSGNPNKRVQRLPALAQALRARWGSAFSFVTTLPPESAAWQRLQAESAALGVNDQIYNLGPVAAEHVPSLIHVCDALCTFSVLESFSNNFVEAWAMGKPLVVTDADWAHDACGAGALFVDPNDAPGSAAALVEVMADNDRRAALVTAGSAQLQKYPNSNEKTQHYVEQIVHALALGRCLRNQRHAIAWPSIQRSTII